MSKLLRVLSFVSLVFAALACSLPGVGSAPPAAPPVDIPAFTPTVESKPTDPPAPPTLTPEPTSLRPLPRTIDPRALAGCDIFVDSDFPDTVGSVPLSTEVLTDSDKKACRYIFASGSLYASIAVSLEGLDAYETVRQFDAISGGVIEPVALGDIAIFQTFDADRTVLDAVLNGWYVTLQVQGFDRKHLLALGELLLGNLVPYYR